MELKEIEKLLQESGMVTLVGAGAVGKTRLAVEAAHRLSEDYDGARLVGLAPLSDSSLVLEQVAAACGGREVPDQRRLTQPNRLKVNSLQNA